MNGIVGVIRWLPHNTVYLIHLKDTVFKWDAHHRPRARHVRHQFRSWVGIGAVESIIKYVAEYYHDDRILDEVDDRWPHAMGRNISLSSR